MFVSSTRVHNVALDVFVGSGPDARGLRSRYSRNTLFRALTRLLQLQLLGDIWIVGGHFGRRYREG